MISQLYIENIAVIEKATIDFQNGFHVFTGETGAGKSIIIDSINAILGSRMSKDIVRTGADKAFVSGVFSNISIKTQTALRDFGYDATEDDLMISREISSDGKSVCKINGRPANMSVLKDIGETLIDVYGQNDSRFLMNEDSHIRFLDLYGHTDDILVKYSESYSKLKHIQKDIFNLSNDDAEKGRLTDLLQYQLNEIDSAELELGEEEELLAAKKRFQNSEKMMDSLTSMITLLDGTEYNQGIRDLLIEFSNQIDYLTSFYPEFSDMSEKISGITYDFDEYAIDIREKLEDVSIEELDINKIEARLDLIYRLKKKYGSTVEEIITFGEKAQEELDNISTSEARLEELKNKLILIEKDVYKYGAELSKARKKASKALEDSIVKELEFLNMPNVKFVVNFESCSPSQHGLENISFYFSPNPGESPKPISKIASGGELSRLMLSLRNISTQDDDVSTMIFDEIDTGVSGLAAEKIGYKLKQVAGERQVLCVTHLAQIASMGHHHYLIEKKTENSKTTTHVTLLDEEGRITEIARIMSGSEPSNATLIAARDMLEKNNN